MAVCALAESGLVTTPGKQVRSSGSNYPSAGRAYYLENKFFDSDFTPLPWLFELHLRRYGLHRSPSRGGRAWQRGCWRPPSPRVFRFFLSDGCRLISYKCLVAHKSLAADCVRIVRNSCLGILQDHPSSGISRIDSHLPYYAAGVRSDSTMARMSRFSRTRVRRSPVSRTATSTMARPKSSARMTWLGNSA
jgi:hypothetical protein